MLSLSQWLHQNRYIVLYDYRSGLTKIRSWMEVNRLMHRYLFCYKLQLGILQQTLICLKVYRSQLAMITLRSRKCMSCHASSSRPAADTRPGPRPRKAFILGFGYTTIALGNVLEANNWCVKCFELVAWPRALLYNTE